MNRPDVAWHQGQAGILVGGLTTLMRVPVMQPPTKPPPIEKIGFIELPQDHKMPDDVLALGGLTRPRKGIRKWWPATGSKFWKIPQRSGPTYYLLIKARTARAKHWIRASRRAGRLSFELLAVDKVPQHILERGAQLQ